MAVVVVCALLMLAGLAAVVRWGGLAVQPPPAPPPPPDVPAGSAQADPPPAGLVARRYLWYVNLALASGFGAGLLAAGAGGRLMMRLLAVTAGPGARGGITEAGQVVGRISVDGTIGFIVFTALFLGLTSGVLYLLLRPWLPVGRMGGIVYARCCWSSPAPGSSRSAGRTPTSTWSAPAGCRSSASPPWSCSTACWSPPWPPGQPLGPLLGTRPAALGAHAPCCYSPPGPRGRDRRRRPGRPGHPHPRRPHRLAPPHPGRAGRIGLALVALLALPASSRPWPTSWREGRLPAGHVDQGHCCIRESELTRGELSERRPGCPRASRVPTARISRPILTSCGCT